MTIQSDKEFIERMIKANYKVYRIDGELIFGIFVTLFLVISFSLIIYGAIFGKIITIIGGGMLGVLIFILTQTKW